MAKISEEPTMDSTEGEEQSEDMEGEESEEFDSDFEFDDEMKQSLNKLLNIPLEFEEDLSEDEKDTQKEEEGLEMEEDDDHEEEHEVQGEENQLEKETDEKEEETGKDTDDTQRKARGDSVERQLEALFVEEMGVVNKDTGLENISDNELDGPESGECDTSDGELPDSPPDTTGLVTQPKGSVLGTPSQPPLLELSDSEVEIVEEVTRASPTSSHPCGKVLVDTRQSADTAKSKVVKPSSGEGSESKDQQKTERDTAEDLKNKKKLKKYLARLDMYRSLCIEYMTQINQKCEVLNKRKTAESAKKRVQLKSVVGKVNDMTDIPQNSHLPRFENDSHSESVKTDGSKRRSTSTEKGRKSNSPKKPRSKSKELKEHTIKYRKYIQYLHSERERCHEEELDNSRKIKSKRKKRKSASKSPEKKKPKNKPRPPVLSFAEFCTSREMISPDKEVPKKPKKSQVSDIPATKKDRTTSLDSHATTTSTLQSEELDEDKELFVTYSDLVEQDKQKKGTVEHVVLEEDRDNIETILEKDPELKSISVFTSVLFKGSGKTGGIPFLQGDRPPSPKVKESFKPKTPYTQSSGPDEIYGWNDDLSNISQCSLSPSHSPAPKLHNKALLNFLENQKQRKEGEKVKKGGKKSKKGSKSSRSRSKSPRKERSRSKKRKKRRSSPSSISVSLSPPPLKPRSPERYKKRLSPPEYQKEKWRDYPSPPPERRREYYEEPPRSRKRSRSRSRTRLRVSSHRSRSSSEERHYRRYRSRSRSRSPPSLAMVQLSAAEKRRKLREEHEKALASLRATIRKPITPLSTTPMSITFTANGDSYDHIRDNYDPVLMNEDSSSESAGEAEALPPLPPEPPPPPALPPAPQVEERGPAPAYPPFIPASAPHMGYWGPGPLQHHMYPGPPPPPAQAFPYPPPHLPYHPHTHPHPHPHPHPHYRMPLPPQSINLINVHQEINKVNTVVINLDDCETEPAKCTHNPLGQNNQTVQEAIDSVRKCLKNCEGVKNKDPRLASADRNKSPERKEGGKNEEKKVKITLNYKPRPVSAVKPDCLLEPEPDKEPNNTCASGNEPSGKTKAGNYSEKNCKIEGIVSKLKETSGCNNKKEDLENVSKRCESPELCKIQPLRINCRDSDVKDPGAELYDPFNTSEENIEEPEQLEVATESVESTEVKSKNIESETKSTSASIPKLSKAEINKINDQINQTFDFILANSIERKRLTPALSEINSKKVQELSKCLKDKPEYKPPISKQCQMLRAAQKMKKKLKKINTGEIKNITTGIDFSSSVVTITTTSKSDVTSGHQISLTEPVSNKMNPEQKSLYTPRELAPTTDLTQFQHVFKSKPSTTETTLIDCNESAILVGKESKMDKEEDSIVLKDKHTQEDNHDPPKSAPCQQNERTDSAIRMENITDIENGKSQIIPQISLNAAISGNLDSIKKNKNVLELTESFQSESDDTMKEIHSDIRMKQEQHESESPKLNFKQEFILEGDSNHIPKMLTESCKKSNTAVEDVQFRNALVEKEDQVGKSDSEIESNCNTKKNSLERPPRSIPTKGELKRFPTPERVFQANISTSQILCEDLKTADLNNIDKELTMHTTSKHVVEKVLTKEKTKRRSSRNDAKPTICQDFGNSNSAEPGVKEVGNEKERKLHTREKQPEEKSNLKKKMHSKNENLDKSLIVGPSLKSGEETRTRKNPRRNNDSLNSNELMKNSTVKTHELEENVETDCKQPSSQSKFLKDAEEITSNKTSQSTPKGSATGVKIQRKSTKIFMKSDAEFAHSKNLQPKPCPLSKKEKSYISQNLPSSFDLSTDHQLIKKGFKKLQVRLSKLTSPSSDNEALSSDMTDNSLTIENKNDVSGFDEDDSNRCNLSDKTEVNLVTQELNKKFMPEETSPNKDKNSQDRSQINDSNLSEMGECTANSPSVEILTCKISNEIEENNSTSDEHALKSSNSNNFKEVFNYYEEIINTLNAFRTTPLTCVKERKSVTLTTPKVEDMPQAKIQDSPKRIPALTNKRNTDMEQTSDECITIGMPDKKEITQEELSVEVVLSRKTSESTSNSNNINCAKSNKSKCSKQNDSDMDDSIILDKELSDLAKDCMDSDSTVGGDDDCLHFGIAASDESSVDSEFGLKRKKTTHKKSKLSSPKNIKRRFSKKLKSLGMDLGTKKIESLDQHCMSSAPDDLPMPEKEKDITSSVKCTLEENNVVIPQEIQMEINKKDNVPIQTSDSSKCNLLRLFRNKHDNSNKKLSEEQCEKLEPDHIVPEISELPKACVKTSINENTDVDISIQENMESNKKPLNDNSEETNKSNIDKKYNTIQEDPEIINLPVIVLKEDVSCPDILQSNNDDEINKQSKPEKIEKKSVEKLEADSSTSSEVVTSTITSRTTRSKSQRVNNSDTYKPNNVLESSFESTGRKTRNKKKTCEITKSESLKVEKDLEDSLPLSVKEDLKIKECKQETKDPQIKSRTSSTDSIDEPLILFKHKLMASKIEVNIDIKMNPDMEEKKFSSGICNLMMNEDVKSKLKSCVSDGNTTSGSGEFDKNNSKSDANSGGNESTSSNNNCPNSEDTLKSQSNISNVSSSDTVVKSSSTSSIKSSDISDISMNTILLGSKEDQDVYLSFFQNKAINPKLKEALKKKRDKAEVDAEIKRRLAEIDELEKLAKNNHERIGTRTRSKTSSKNKNHDVVSISSDDSHSTSDLTTLAVDVNKFEGIHDESSTTLDAEKSLLVHDLVTAKDDSKSELLQQKTLSGSNESILYSKGKPDNDNIQNVSKLNTPANLHEELDCSELNSKETSVKEKPICHLLLNEFYGCSSEIVPPSNISPDIKNKSSEKELISKENKSFQKETTSKENVKKSRRNVLSVYQFRESDEEDVLDNLEEMKTRRNSNRFSKTRSTVAKNCKIKDDETFTEEPPQELTRKRANINNITCGTTSNLSTDCYKDLMSENQKQKDQSGNSTPENLYKINPKEKLMQTLIPEPDSSTSAMTDTNCSLSKNVDNSSVMAGDTISKGDIQTSEQMCVESSLHEPPSQLDVVESSPMTSFRPPNRKSLVTRRRRRRKICLGRSVPRRVEQQENEMASLNDSDAKSEEAVSSSVTTLELPSKQTKQRRKRKTFIDLLMEDSMLSVTRDFPMSPNPYVLPTFYKDIELPSSNNKVDTSAIDRNTKMTGIGGKSPPKPDVLAQKLRLLEKLKCINRKNRKTRQCRTLVCYNEDSLPESLVETPEGECAQSISDVEMSPQGVSSNEDKKEESSFKDQAFIHSDHLAEQPPPSTEDKPTTTATSELRKIRKNINAPKKQLKSNTKKGKLNKDENETIDDVISGSNTEVTENKEINSVVIEKDTELVQNNINSKSDDLENKIGPEKEELSDFDKLLENKSPVPSQGVKFNYGLPITQSPYEDKSNDISDDYYDSFPSPLPSNSDYETTSEGEEQKSKNTCEPPPIIKPGCSSDDYKPSRSKKPKLTIMCSILKEKVGHMLPYFGESGNDSVDSDEDIPLAIKLSKCDKNYDLTVLKNNETSSSAEGLEILPITTTRPPLLRRSGRIPKESSPVRKSERNNARSSTALSLNPLESGDIEVSKDVDKLEECSSQDSQLLLNVKSTSPLLRKSSRKSRSPHVLNKETTNLEMDKINNENEQLNENMIEDSPKINLDNAITDKATPVKRRGRAPKLKTKEDLKNHEQNNEEKILPLVESKSCTENTKPSPNIVNNELCLNKGKGRKLRNKCKSKHIPFNNENEESINTKKADPNTILDCPLLQQSELDLVTNENVSKSDDHDVDSLCVLKNSLKDSNGDDNQNNPDGDTNSKPSAETDYNSTKLRNCRKGKLLALNNIRQYFPSENSDSELDNFKDSKDSLQNRMEKESSVTKVLNESPPPLIKTRSRRPRLNELDNYQEPPNLDTPYTSDLELNNKVELESSVVNSSSLLDKNKNQNEENLPKRKGRKPLLVNSSNTPENETGCVIFQKNKRELNRKNKNVSEDKPVFTRKRGKRGKRTTALKKSCKVIEPFFKELSDSDRDSESEVSTLLTENPKETVEGQDFESPDLLKETKVSQEENELVCNDNTDSVTPTENLPSCNLNSQLDTPVESKRKRKSKAEASELPAAVTIAHDSSLEDEKESTKNDFVKKRKLEDSEQHEECRTPTPSYSAPSTSRNTFRETQATVDHGCNSQSLLWNKISGFLNKTTRSVGTQVRTKNMNLKGFETSEPQVSLQSELTLPQVIKTLFEELKALDSSFSNP